MATFQNKQMLEVLFGYREIALQYLLSSDSIKFKKIITSQKTDSNNVVGITDGPSMFMADAMTIHRLQLAIAVEKEINEWPKIEEKLIEILTKAKIALYENNQEKIQKV